MHFLRILILFVFVIMAGGFYLTQNSNDSLKQEVTTLQPAPLEYEREKSQAFNYLNDIREASGLIRLSAEPLLEYAAQNHARYLISNDILAHEQIHSFKDFTGVEPSDRAIFAGYLSSFVTENISGGNLNYKDSVDTLFSAIYHRFAFLDFGIDEIGIGILQNPAQRSKTAFVYNMGLSSLNQLCSGQSFTGYGRYVYGVCADKNFKIKESDYQDAVGHVGIRNQKTVIYPYHGQKDVPPAFFDEIPDPLPDHRVSGFPVSISFNEAYFKQVRIISFELFDVQNNKVVDTLFHDANSDPNKKFKKFEYALFPLERLQWNSRYQVRIAYLTDGKQEEKAWSFHTMAFAESLYEVTPESYHYTIQKNVSSIFYFKPLSQNDILENITFPDHLYVAFIDQNTLRITATDQSPDTIELVFGTHRLVLDIN